MILKRWASRKDRRMGYPSRVFFKRLLVLLVAVCLFAGAGSAVSSASRASEPSAPSNGIPAPVQAAFLGDSYTYGIGATKPTDGYAYLVAKDEHWTADIVGLPGSGYVRIATHDGKTIAAGLASVIAAQPQVVIVECGHNDTDPGVKFARTKAAALEDLRAVRVGLPDALIVVVGPIWLNQDPTGQALAVRNAVHAAQQKILGSLWIDPIAQRWFTGTRHPRTGDAATMINAAVGHPNDAGYEHIATRLEADLAALGVGGRLAAFASAKRLARSYGLLSR